MPSGVGDGTVDQPAATVPVEGLLTRAPVAWAPAAVVTDTNDNPTRTVEIKPTA
jgi:hypothetical protein